MKSKAYFIGIIFLTIIVLFVGGCRRAGRWLVKENNPQNADAMIILMGNIPDRVLLAADLYTQKVAGKIMIVKESMGAFRALEERGVQIVSNSRQVNDALISLGISSDSILLLPGEATSTQMEAEIIRDYLIIKPGIDTLLLVSSAPHTRRASMIFNAAFKNLDEPVAVFCSPSKYTNFNAEKWWKSKEGIQVVFFEYVKIANFLLFDKKKLKK